MTRWLGIDAGEGFHEMVLLDAAGQKAQSVKVANQAEAIEVALRGLVQAAVTGMGHGVPFRQRKFSSNWPVLKRCLSWAMRLYRGPSYSSFPRPNFR